MSILTYVRWGLTRKSHLYRPVYFSVFLMSALTFLSLSLLPVSVKEIAATVGNGSPASKAANAPGLLFALGSGVGIIQILLVLVRVQLDRSAEYRVLGAVGISRYRRAVLAALENAGHVAMASSAGVFLGTSIIITISLLSPEMDLLASSRLLATIPLAILLPIVISSPICAILAANRRSK